MRIVMHIDVNNAFLSWEAIYLLNNGYKYDIRNSYAVIGGDEENRHGIVLAKSNPAKKLGIVTAEPLYSARKKCKILKIYKPHFDFYKKMSDKMMNLISEYTPDIEIASIDECYIEYTNIQFKYNNPLEFAKKLQKEIYDILGFTVNIGIANNKLCAKMASDFSKPFKIHTLFDNEIEEKMYPLPIGELFGIGRKTTPKLKLLGIETIGDLANYNIDKLKRHFKNQASYMIDTAKGINNDKVISEQIEVKGISHSITLKKDILNKEEVYKVITNLVELVSIELRNKDKYAYVITTFIKDNTFKVTRHQRKIKNATNNTNVILKIAKELYDEMENDIPIRLIGVGVDKFTTSATYQISLFENNNVKELTKLDKTLDQLKQKYGLDIIKNASITKK